MRKWSLPLDAYLGMLFLCPTRTINLEWSLSLVHASKRDFLAKEDFSNLLHYTPHIVSVKHTKQAMIYTAKFKKLCNTSVTKIYWPFFLGNSLLWNLFLFATFKTSFFLPPFDLIRKYVQSIIDLVTLFKDKLQEWMEHCLTAVLKIWNQ